jgi:hypothetical protein
MALPGPRARRRVLRVPSPRRALWYGLTAELLSLIVD